MNKFKVTLEWHQNIHWSLDRQEPQRNVGMRFASDMWDEPELRNLLMNCGLFMNDVIHGAYWPEGSNKINVKDNRDGRYVLTVDFDLGPADSFGSEEKLKATLDDLLSNDEHAISRPFIKVEEVEV